MSKPSAVGGDGGVHAGRDRLDLLVDGLTTGDMVKDMEVLETSTMVLFAKSGIDVGHCRLIRGIATVLASREHIIDSVAVVEGRFTDPTPRLTKFSTKPSLSRTPVRFGTEFLEVVVDEVGSLGRQRSQHSLWVSFSELTREERGKKKHGKRKT